MHAASRLSRSLGDPGCDTVEVFLFCSIQLLHNARHHSVCASALLATPAPLPACPRLLAPRVQRGARGGRGFLCTLLGSGDREGSGDVRLFECSACEPEQDCSLVSTQLNCSLAGCRLPSSLCRPGAGFGGCLGNHTQVESLLFPFFLIHVCLLRWLSPTSCTPALILWSSG